jgi:hypothetical protein
MKYVRSVLGVVVGIVVAMVLITVIETINFIVYKPAEAPDVSEFGKLIEWNMEFGEDPEKVCAWVKTLPVMAMLVVQMGWSVGSFVGGWVSAKIAGWGHLVHAGLIGLFVLVGTIWNLYEMKSHGYEHPGWMIVLGLLLPLPLSLLGGKIASLGAVVSQPPASNP